ncbi:MAG: restriction endonuclease subunit S [Thioclava marina]|uniref:Type I restriction-modification system, S subunit n=1 Tax=Thioclava atlantica TaxID=1317124 RepID=A0A085TRB2_9RHOB|nr:MULTISPECIES: restriction endonuclease subunit S [Thioclava]KFE33259.1 type I restriction-modification system, S subunit [Thioclava atlantica]MBC7145677.1 restriction endonuclease subunit S [Thioclava marina]
MSELPISQVAEINPRSYPPNGLKLSDPVSFIPMADVSESGAWIGHKRGPLIAAAGGYTNFQEGDVLLAKITPCLENGKGTHAVGLWNGYGYGSTEFHVLRAKGSVLARYLFHVTQHEKFRVKAEMQMTGTAGQRRVPTDFFDRYCAYVPSKAEQSKIAEILDTLDAAIRGTEAVVAKLKAMKQGLLNDLLTRGIDANGDLRPPQPEAPHLYKQTPLGWLPKEWAFSSVGDTLAEPTRNGLYKPAAYHGRGPLMVQMGCLFSDERVNFSGATRVSVSPMELNYFGLQNGDLLFARRSLVFEGAGLCAIVKNLPEASTFESSIIRLRLTTSKILSDFAGLFFRGFASSSQRRTLIRQVAVSGVTSGDIKSLYLPLPDLVEQGEIIQRYSAINHTIHGEDELLAKLRLQKSGLMDDLLTGRTPVTALL